MQLLKVIMAVVMMANWTAKSSAMDHLYPHYLNGFAVQLDGGPKEAEAVASELGFVVDRMLPNIGVFLLTHPELNHPSKRSADNLLSRLEAHPKVHYVQQEVELKRVKRSIVHDKQLELPIREIKDNSAYHREKLPDLSVRDTINDVTFNDPYYNDMWYLENHGQSGGEKYLDLNLQVVWASGFTGEGVVVCILDDGVDHTHPDLADNYDPRASGDLNDKSDGLHDPMPNVTNPGNSHGTRCAGEVAAAANNDVCGVGVSYKASIGGVRILDGTVTDALEGEALTLNNDYVDIYSASWGPTDDGKTMEAPNFFASQAMKDGVLKGRRGLGNIFVWATGNGGINSDNCNADGYTSSIETLSVGSVTDWGRQPFYMENCSSTLAVVPTGGEEHRGEEMETDQLRLKVVTTDIGGGCIENFQGTSSAAPLAAGCVATVLQANPALTWRDVQHVVVRGTRIPSVDSSWTINGAGHHVSHKFGFGLMDCGKMVHEAQNWENVPEQHVCQFDRNFAQTLDFGGHINDTLYVDACKGDKAKWIQRLEHVQVRLKLSTRRRGDTHIFLTSPSGTQSELLSGRPHDDHQGEWEFTFMTVHSWDENPEGSWCLDIYDNPLQDSDGSKSMLSKLKSALDGSSLETKGYLSDWSLILYGTAGKRYERDFASKQGQKKSYKPSEEALQRLKRDETESARRIQVKRASTGKYKQEKNADVETRGSSETLRNLTSLLRSLLEQQQAHEHVKRILEQHYPQLFSEKSQTAMQHKSNLLHKETQDLLKAVLQRLERMSNNEKLRIIIKLKEWQAESLLKSQKHAQKRPIAHSEQRNTLTELLLSLKKYLNW